MANTNWFIGIDEGSSTPGGSQVAKAGFIFVDPSFVGVSDGSPDAPYQTLQAALTATIGNGSVIGSDKYGFPIYSITFVLATGTYSEFNLQSSSPAGNNSYQFIANIEGTVTFLGTGSEYILDRNRFSNNVKFVGINCKDCSHRRRENEIYITNCFLDNGEFECNQSGSGTGGCADVKFIDCIVAGSNVGGGIKGSITAKKCTFINTPLDSYYGNLLGGEGELIVENCDFDSNSPIRINDNFDFISSSFTNSHLRGGVINIDTPANNNVTEINPLSPQDPEHIGSTALGEYLISETSPLIGAGTNDSTIGAFRVGFIIDLSAPVENNDITVGPPITITNPATTGNIKPQFQVLSQIRKSPIVLYNGFLDGTNDIPDNETNLIEPQRNVVNISYKETLGGLESSSEFLYKTPMFIETTNTPGDDNFDCFAVSSDGDLFNNRDRLNPSDLINVAEIQPDIVLNDK